MAYEFRRTRRVEFADTDTAGIVHFSNFMRYMEETEHAFLRSLGLSVHRVISQTGAKETGAEETGVEETGGETVGFPRLATRAEFRRPLVFEDEVDIWLRVARKKGSTITYQFVFEKDTEQVAVGELVVISCRLSAKGKPEKVPLPAAYEAAIEVAPYEPLEFR